MTDRTHTYEQLSALCAQMAAALEAMIDHVADDEDEADDEWTCVKKSRAALTAYRTLSPDPQWQRVPEGHLVVHEDGSREMWAAAGDALVGMRLNKNHDIVSTAVWNAMIGACKRARGEG